ncbi:MAG: tetratricopeptide repeat protein, partial [Limnoraphis robusta]
MKPNFTDWDVDIPNDPQDDYQAFIRGLQRREGFGLFFVECSPAEGEKLIEKVKNDIPQKTIKVLRLTEQTENLYAIVNDLPNRDNINILFISGLEHSLYNYELRKLTQGWSSREKYTYSLKGVPPILSHLNQQRERFRDDFKICFVFLVPKFILNYFIHRAPDFFDWRSGFFELPSDPEFANQRYTQLIEEGDIEKYKNLTPDEQREKFLEIQELLAEEHLLPDEKVELLFELGLIFAATEKDEEAVASWDQAIKIQPDYVDAWTYRGNALVNLGRYEEAVASYDQAIKIKPDFYEAWNNRGNALRKSGRYEEAVASYEQAIKFKPDYHYAWNNRGNALGNLGRYEEAVASYEQAIKIKPDYVDAWYKRGIALDDLGRYEEAVASYDQAIKIKPDYYEAWNNQGAILCDDLNDYENAFLSFEKAIEIKPDDHVAWNNRGIALDNL